MTMRSAATATSSAHRSPAGFAAPSPPITSSRRAIRSASSRCSAARSILIAPKIRGARPARAARPAKRAARSATATCCSASSRAARSRRADAAASEAGHAAATGLVFRAPTSGRYYSRSSPDKPAFVTAGAELAPGATVCLLEVMKTFNRVTYSGARVRVTELLVADGADVNAGDPLLALEPV